MWKARPDEKPAPSNPAPNLSTTSNVTKELNPPRPLMKASEHSRSEVAAHIGKSVFIKGELSGSEDLYLDGEVEGTIELRDHTLIIGPNGRVHANISAREVVLHGRVEGNITGAHRVELKKSSSMVGNITSQRIVIEDEAFFKGSVDLQAEPKSEPRKAAAAAAGAGSYSSFTSPQASLLEQK